MPRPVGEDLTGRRIGRLTVLKQVPTPEGKIKKRYYLCLCDCGNTAIVSAGNLTRKKPTRSCGCLLQETRNRILKEGRETRNGDSVLYSRLLTIWTNMHRRCENPTDSHYKYYGEQGIKVCDEWFDWDNFKYWALHNGYRDDLTIDRIDNDGNYEPDNCRWATLIEQANNKHNNVHITYRGETHTIPEWSRILDIPYKTLHARLRRTDSNFTLEEAMTLPVGAKPQALQEKHEAYYNRNK